MTRQRRDPADKAQEALDIAQRKLAKLNVKHTALIAEARGLQGEIRAVEVEAAYLAQNPHLTPETQPTEEPTP
jgi:hypothetical protein